MPMDHRDQGPGAEVDNPLKEYFDKYREGPGIWKWSHYFEIYHRYFAKFIGKPVNILEIGIYSGGSLGMWRSYFGKHAQIIGVDIEPSCKYYEDEMTKILIGDQGDPKFWNSVYKDLPDLDIVIDDGGHEFEQQRVTLQALWPKIRPSGVYFCEGIHPPGNKFATLVHDLCHNLNEAQFTERDPNHLERRLVCRRSKLQKKVYATHHYPFVTVIEMNEASVSDELIAPKRGTSWEPFLV